MLPRLSRVSSLPAAAAEAAPPDGGKLGGERRNNIFSGEKTFKSRESERFYVYVSRPVGW